MGLRVAGALQLNPPSDNEESNINVVAKDTMPAFDGTTEAFAAVKLHAAPINTSNLVQIGSTTADSRAGMVDHDERPGPG